MNVVFVYYDAIRPGDAAWRGAYYSGIGSLSAVLKEKGFNTSLMHIIQPIKEDEFLRRLRHYKPDIVAFSSTTNVFPNVKWLGNITKQNFDVLTVIGGPHAILSPNSIIKEKAFDIVCVGEGEIALSELCLGLSRAGKLNTHIDNLWIKHNGRLHKNKCSIVSNLDELPFPDKSIFDYKNLSHVTNNIGVFMASRGCPYDCSYCCSKSLISAIGATAKSYVRFKSVGYIIDEMKYELRTYDFIKKIHFEDDILPLKENWFKDFIERYKKEINLPFECNLRPNLANEKIITLLKEGNCDRILVGIESGNDFIREKVLNRKISRKKIMETFRLCNDIGIETFSFNMMGIPCEDSKMMLDTVKLNAKVDTHQSQVTIFFPYPKTPLHDLCKTRGLLTRKNLPNYEIDTILKYGIIKKNQIRFMTFYFRMLVTVYRILHKLPFYLSNFAIKGLDHILSVKLMSILIFPIFIRIMILVRSNEKLFYLGKYIRTKFFEKHNK